MSLTSGNAYHILNLKAGTAVDLSGADNKSIIGYPEHDGANQQWIVEWDENAWTLHNVRSPEVYIGLGGDIDNGTRLVGAEEGANGTKWHIYHEETYTGEPGPGGAVPLKVFAANTSYAVDLYGHGLSTPGNPITLWSNWNATHQDWWFYEVESTPSSAKFKF
ncbi:carbohydrate-binding module family 13 protein [Cylindrobasidium torrendii FP15055 ss-10]|uniref:Carbohydrate-binding module family 13 protein n=1 Tax=Cylindrobasidium torrendii FP15055 ss-10 TaxID=1314674 RepID=A0A0D7B9Q9_9AGAR|nr:carbohydrate-binding module family 13 protein [Cylindrobasidium torrendii FP15055 ss-10]